MPGLVDLMRDIAVAPGPPRRGRDAAAVAVRPVAALRLRRRVPLRGRRAAGRAARRRAGARLHLLAELLGAGGAARAARPERSLAPRPSALQWLTPSGRPATPRTSPSCSALLGPLTTDEVAGPLRGRHRRWLGWLVELERRAAGHPGPDRRRGAVGRDRGRRPAARRARRGAAGRRAARPSSSRCADPLGDLVARYARTHGPFTASDVAAAVRPRRRRRRRTRSRRLAAAGRVVAGEFRARRRHGTEWCDAEVLRLLRRRSLAALRKEIEPVPPTRWPRSCRRGSTSAVGCAASTALLRVVEQLQGAPCPASALERLVLPAGSPTTPRPCSTSCAPPARCVWAGHGSLPGDDGWVVAAPRPTPRR